MILKNLLHASAICMVAMTGNLEMLQQKSSWINNLRKL